MPELPEVETIARQLREGLVGRQLGDVDLARPDVVRGATGSLPVVLPGSRVVAVERRAKRVLVSLDPPGTLIFHLGMTGRLTISRVDAVLEAHTHLRIGIAPVPVRRSGGRHRARAAEGTAATELRFRDPRRFGGVWLLAAGDEGAGPWLGPVGPEPLTLGLAEFRRILARRRQIKALLLDQGAIAGLGNIYCDESLHAAGIHPLTPASEICDADVQRLLGAIKRILNRAIGHRGTTLVDYRSPDGEPGSFRRLHKVYQREGEACRGCRGTIVRIVAAGRSTFLCERCQRQ